MASMFSDSAQTAYCAALLLSAVALFVIVTRRPIRIRINSGQYFRILALGVVTSLGALMFVVAVNRIDVAGALFLSQAANIVVAVLLGKLFFNERLNGQAGIAVGCALIGVSLYTGVTFDVGIGSVAALVSGVFVCTGFAIRKLVVGIPRSTVMLHQFAIGFLVSSAIAVAASGDAIRQFDGTALFAGIAYTGVALLGQILLLYGFAHFNINLGAIILTSELVFGALVGWVAFNEIPTLLQMVGGMFIAAAAVIAAVRPSSDVMKAPIKPT